MAVAIAAFFAAWAALVQRPTPNDYLALEEYWRLAQQFATGAPLHGEVPFAYRIAVPWMASRIASGSLRGGFLIVNVAFGILTAPLLVLWLRRFIRYSVVRLALVIVYAATWLNPVRFPFANPVYVDPPFVALVICGLIAVESVRTKFSIKATVCVSLCCVAGTLVRETMLLVALAWLFADDPIAIDGVRPPTSRTPAWARWLPLAVSMATLTAIHLTVGADGSRTFTGAALQWVRKPLSSFLLAWLTVFGPLLAVLSCDARRAGRFLVEHQALGVFLIATTTLAWIGGADTERFLCWALPIVFVLIGMSLERYWRAIVYPPIAVALIGCQAIAARVFWSIPDVDGGTPVALDAATSIGSRVYGFFDRLLIIDGFYWNLWSSFGSAGFRLIRLAAFGAVTLIFVLAIQRRERALSER